MRFDHAVYPSAVPGGPVQHRSEVTVPVGVGKMTWCQSQPSLLETDDPLQMWDSHAALLSPETANRGGFSERRSPNPEAIHGQG
jgi:hypothetical protein